jgi:hypothetical protein
VKTKQERGPIEDAHDVLLQKLRLLPIEKWTLAGKSISAFNVTIKLGRGKRVLVELTFVNRKNVLHPTSCVDEWRELYHCVVEEITQERIKNSQEIKDAAETIAMIDKHLLPKVCHD